jgi:hypothetical protein
VACKSYPFHELYGNDKVDIKEKQKANFKFDFEKKKLLRRKTVETNVNFHFYFQQNDNCPATNQEFPKLFTKSAAQGRRLPKIFGERSIAPTK